MPSVSGLTNPKPLLWVYLGQLAQQVRQTVHEVQVEAHAAPHVRPLNLHSDLAPPIARRQHALVHLQVLSAR